MKSGEIIVILAGVFLFALSSYLITLHAINQETKPQFSPATDLPNFPTTCSTTDINAFWENIFVVNSTGITIISNSTSQNYCADFIAYKNDTNQTNVLAVNSNSTNGTINFIRVSAGHGNLTENSKTAISSITTTNLTLTTQLSLFSNILAGETRINPIGSETEASTEFNQSFKIENASAFTYNTINTHYNFTYNETPEIENTTSIVGIVQESNYYNQLTFIKFLPPETFSCTPVWTAQNTSCTPAETYTTYYTDLNNCPLSSKANETTGCDYNENGLIGEVGDINSNANNIDVEINEDVYNSTLNYTGTKKVDIYSGNRKMVSFEWNFTIPLNFRQIEITKQSSASNYGSIIISGLEVEKEATIDRISNKTQVCVKERQIEDIDEIDDDCRGIGERLVPCPGEFDNIECNISNNYFIVSGISHSAVLEYQEIITSCAENWSYSSWGPCLNNQQTRTATDVNGCGTVTTRDPIIQTCESTNNENSSTCTPNWKCTEWTPTKCPQKGEQTRTCTDLNNCGTNEEPTNQICQRESSNIILIAILTIAVIITFAIILILIHYLRNRNASQSYNNSLSNWPPISPQIPPTFPPTNPTIQRRAAPTLYR